MGTCSSKKDLTTHDYPTIPLEVDGRTIILTNYPILSPEDMVELYRVPEVQTGPWSEAVPGSSRSPSVRTHYSSADRSDNTALEFTAEECRSPRVVLSSDWQRKARTEYKAELREGHLEGVDLTGIQTEPTDCEALSGLEGLGLGMPSYSLSRPESDSEHCAPLQLHLSFPNSSQQSVIEDRSVFSGHTTHSAPTEMGQKRIRGQCSSRESCMSEKPRRRTIIRRKNYYLVDPVTGKRHHKISLTIRRNETMIKIDG